VKTLEDVERVREIADRLEELGVPRKDVDKIRRRANEAQKRIRDEAR
jgi:hypothetical protein